MDHKEKLQRILSGEITPQEIIDDCLAVLAFGDKHPGPNTKIDDELFELIIQDLRNGEQGKRPCYYDAQTDSLKNGLPFRK